MADKITVLLVDDHALVRCGFRRMLEDDAAIAVVGEASDGAEGVKLARQLRPAGDRDANTAGRSGLTPIQCKRRNRRSAPHNDVNYFAGLRDSTVRVSPFNVPFTVIFCAA